MGSAVADRAIDGNTDGNYNNSSVSHTLYEDSDRWWQVDLGKDNRIYDIVIYNRTGSTSYSERLSNFTVTVIDSDGDTTFSQLYADYPNPSLTINTGDGGITGQIVKISKSSEGPINLAEVEVYGADTAILSDSESVMSELHVFPNPVSTTFTVLNGLGAELEVYDMLGKLMLKTRLQTHNQSVDVSAFNSGVYFLEFINNSKTVSKKIVKL